MRDSTLKNIAQQVGVSVSTVSRVLNGKARQYNISKKTEAAVKLAAKELDYRPNKLAQSLRLQRTHSLGLVIPDISNPFFSGLARSIEIQARKAGYSIVLYDSQEDVEFEIESIQSLQSRKVDGCIICPVGLENEHLEKWVNHNRIPLVVVDRSFPNMNCSSVTADNYGGALEAISFLIEKGHTVIGCIQGLTGNTVNNKRIQGYFDGHIKFDLPIEADLIVGNSFGEESGYEGAKVLLSRSERPTAIYACSNLIALGAMRAIREAELDIPGDVSLMAFDNETYFEYLSTPITAVSQPREEMGEKAFELLIEQIESGKQSVQNITLPTKIIVRQSVKQLNKHVVGRSVGKKVSQKTS